MKEIFERKLKEYKALRPVPAEAKKWIEDSNIWLSLYTSLCLQSIRVGKMTIVNILQGQILEDINMGTYNFCFRFKDTYKAMVSASEMQSSLNRKVLDDLYADLFMPEQELHRKDCSVVYDIGFIPCHFSDIAENMDKLLRYAEHIDDPVEAAMAVTLGLVKIYPYGKDSIVMAYVAGLYYLIKAGIPLPSLPVSEDEYVHILSLYINNGDEETFRDMYLRSLMNRTETVLSVCMQAADAAAEE